MEEFVGGVRLKKRKRINAYKLIRILFFSLLLIICTCLFLNSDLFNIKEVVINNNKNISRKEINKLLNIDKEKNIFSYDLEKLEKKVEGNNYIKECHIKRKLPNKLIVEIQEKNIIGPLYNNKSYCYIDDKGKLIDEKKDLEDDSFIINVDYSIRNNKVKFTNNDKEVLLTLIRNLKEENILRSLSTIDLNDISTINMKCKSGLTINLNKDEKIDKNITKLSRVLIDLRNRKQTYGSVDFTCSTYILYKPYSK